MQTRTCIKCQTEFVVQLNSDPKKFCSRSCSASYNNSATPRNSKQANEKRSSSLKGRISPKRQIGSPYIFRKNVEGPYSKLYYNTCAKTGKVFIAPSYRKYSSEAIYSNRKLYADSCRFTFNAYDYPFIEGFEQLDKIKWYHPIKNPNGVSRDHLFSVSDGWDNHVDPEIMKHPANCRFVPHIVNQQKRAKSIITLEELMIRIEGFGGGDRN